MIKNSLSCARNMEILDETCLGARLYPQLDNAVRALFLTNSKVCLCLLGIILQVSCHS